VFPSGTAKQRPFRIDEQAAPGDRACTTERRTALRAHQEARARAWADTNVRVVFNADEERLSPTSREVIGAEARRVHSVGILEPTRASKSWPARAPGNFTLEVMGKAAHAGLQPELVASAIWDLAQKVAALHALTDLEKGTTVNVGTVQGGERAHVVADSLELPRRCRVNIA